MAPSCDLKLDLQRWREPTHIKVKVVEVAIIQIAAMPNEAAGRQRSHFDSPAVSDYAPERVMFQQAIAKKPPTSRADATL